MATHPRILFARVGWMRYYHNWMPDDEPVGGGSYNKENTGSEVANFFPWNGNVYGFFQTPVGSRLDFQRIDPHAVDAEQLPKVLLIFVAKRPTGGQVVVGWYRNAILLPEPRRSSPHPQGRNRWHNAIANRANAVLLPLRKRTVDVKGGRGGFGQANVCYPFTPDGRSKLNSWMKKAITFAEQYDGPNLMHDHSVDEMEEAVERLDAVAAASKGQGFTANSAQRHAVEKLAMRRAMKHFKKTFPVVRDVCLEGRSYDVHCQKRAKELWVEVKGTTGDGSSVFLTRKEYELAQKGNSALYVLHSIRLNKNRASGGIERVLTAWDVAQGKAVPVVYSYTLPVQE